MTRDTWISAAKGEEEASNGGAAQLKVKSCQEMSIVDCDLAALRGRVVTAAELCLRPTGKSLPARLTISTLATPFVEGRARSYEREEGASSFRWSETARSAWTEGGGDLTEVCLGSGATLWSMSDPRPADEHGFLAYELDPCIVAARAIGVSHGFVVFDDVGSEYTRDGEAFQYQLFPNRFVASREAGDESAPYFRIVLGVEDHEPPDAPGELTFDSNLDAPSVTWRVPGDHGPAGTLAFEVRFETSEGFDWDVAREAPRERIPMATKPGKIVAFDPRCLVRDRRREITCTLAVRALDAAGNASSIRTIAVHLPADVARLDPAPASPTAGAHAARDAGSPAGAARDLSLVHAVLDPLEKIEVDTGRIVPSRADAASSDLFDRTAGIVRLASTRAGFAAFQVVTPGDAAALSMRVLCDDEALGVKLCIGHPVRAHGGRFVDPLVPWDGARPRTGTEAGFPPVSYSVTWIDVYAAKSAPPGWHRFDLELQAGERRSRLSVELDVSPFIMPDRLSFVPEMNAYALADPPADHAWYRLAHEHRTVLNRLGYDWRGRVHDRCGPTLGAAGFDWSAYDEHFGALYDGSLFADLPRGAIPVETAYLPLNEAWPASIETGFRGGYWADQALSPDYWTAFESGVEAFAAHLAERGWNHTLFEVYFNNKVEHKRAGWSRSSAPWTFDEPTHTQDFLALRTYGEHVHAALARSAGPRRVFFRVDVSRPEWERDLLEGVADVQVVGSAITPYRERVVERKRRANERVLRYAQANAVDASNAMAVAWCLDTWCLGADGVVPWQTIGTSRSWDEGDALALLYPARGADGAPVASARLKAFRRGQEDVELAEAWRTRNGLSRNAAGAAVARLAGLRALSTQEQRDDAGDVSFPGTSPARLRALRRALIAALGPAESSSAVPFVEALPGLRSPARIAPFRGAKSAPTTSPR